MLKKIISLLFLPFRWFFRTSRRNRIIILVLLLPAGFFLVRKITSGKTNGYVFAVVTPRTITETVSESGTVAVANRINVFSPSTGVIGEVYVTNGQAVISGQKLFTVKSTATAVEKAAALATYRAAQAAVQQAENNRRDTQATVDRVHDDLKNKDTTETFTQKETRTTAEVAHDNAYDSLLSAQAALESARVAFQATQNATVTAPVSGVVSNLSVVTGSAVSVYNALVPAAPAVVIGGLGPAEITISLGESDINKIKVGQITAVTLDAIANQIYSGVVARFDDYGTITQGVVKYTVYLQITDADTKIKPGMTADVDIVTRELTDVLSVPNSAVKPYQKGRAVRVLTGRDLEYVPVTIGARGKEYTQILQGLDAGQEIIVSLTNDKAPRSSPFGF